MENRRDWPYTPTMPGHFNRRAQAPDVSAHREFYARGGYTGDPEGPESVADDMTLYLSSQGFADGGPVDDFFNQYQSQYYAGGGKVAKMIRSLLGEGEKPVKAYHGSPHDFDAFDASKIGTGEGHQSYGHGIYLAESPAVATSYRDALGDVKTPEHMAAVYLDDAGGDVGAAIAKMIDHIVNPFQDTKLIRGGLDVLKNSPDPALLARPGRMYETAVHADPTRFLHWEKPLSEQSEAVQSALAGFGFKPDRAGRMAYEEALQRAGRGDASVRLPSVTPDPFGQNIYRSIGISDANPAAGAAFTPRYASDALSEAGIPGIRYFDQLSRGAGAGTHNYVIFPGMEDIIEILRKYAEGGSVDGGGP